MFRNIAIRIGWAMLVGWMILACSSNNGHLRQGNSLVTPDCQWSLKRQEDSVIQAYKEFNENDDTVNSKISFDLIKVLADKGCATSQYYAGSALLKSDNQKAIQLLTSAAEKGNAEAQFELQNEYSQGHWEDNNRKWVLRDSGLAAFYQSMAVAQGYPPSLVFLANQKIREAFILFQRAADSGSLDGIKYVAKAYEFGIGVEDELGAMYRKSYLYYSVGAMLAAPVGHCHDFKEKAEEYEKGKTRREIERLHEYVQHWFEKHPSLKKRLKDGGKCP